MLALGRSPMAGLESFSPPWKLTAARRSAPDSASSNTLVPPKQKPIAARRVASTRGWARNAASAALSRRSHVEASADSAPACGIASPSDAKVAPPPNKSATKTV